jgi:N utilization substance protein A
MNAEFFAALDQLEAEKGISKEYMIERIEAALVSALKKEDGANAAIRVVLDPVKKDLKVYSQKTIVEEVNDPSSEITLEDAKKISRRYVLGGVAEIPVQTKNLRRLSTMAAKQIIVQGIREAERSNQIKEYESKREEIISAEVIKVDDSDGSVVLDTGTSRAVLRREEQIPGERFEVGDRVKVFITEVRREQRGPIVTLSRKHEDFVKRMFELEVPEIKDGTVVIEGVAREAGARTKIAVASRDSDVDPVGACIGNRGMRIASIVDELRGEKIDVVRYSENLDEYVAEALSPAKVISVKLEDERVCSVKVSPDQLSLAIGKVGQNARLAARLTRCKIDIKAD